MEDIGANLVNFIASSTPYCQIGMGTASGWLTGYLIMKIGKFAIAVLGGAIILLKMAEIEKLVNINWPNVKENVQSIPLRPLTNLSYTYAGEIPANIQSFVISFIGGSLIGVGCS